MKFIKKNTVILSDKNLETFTPFIFNIKFCVTLSPAENFSPVTV